MGKNSEWNKFRTYAKHIKQKKFLKEKKNSLDFCIVQFKNLADL